MSAGTPVVAEARRIRTTARALAVCLSLFVAASLLGCDSADPIIAERVPKDAPPVELSPPPTGETERMLAAIIPAGDTAWFLKITGPDETVAAEKGRFLDLVKSLRLEEGVPKWTLPEKWTQRSGTGMRFATIEVPTDPPLELAVTSLAMPDGDREEYLVDNVNRWRSQMGLGAIGKEKLHTGGDLDDETVELKLDDGTPVTLVNLAGQFESGGMNAPFAGGLGRGAATAGAPMNERAASPLVFDVPDGWKALGADGISKASFAAAGGAVKITVTDLGASANSVLTNVNRWRGQVGLPAIDEGQLDETLETIRLGDGEEGQIVALTSPADHEPQDAILGVIAVRGATMWFVKLRGVPDAALGEKQNFENFVKSLRFSEAAN